MHLSDEHTAGFTHVAPFGSEWSAIHLDGVTAKRHASLCLASHTVVALSLLQASPILARAACENKDIEPIIAIVTKILLNIFFPLCWVVRIMNSKLNTIVVQCLGRINVLFHQTWMYRETVWPSTIPWNNRNCVWFTAKIVCFLILCYTRRTPSEKGWDERV